jgi:hypothetical protein
METQATDRLHLAAQFVSSTNSPIFLTGKAGTGKTTFLKELNRTTHKSHVIVAPTGIAALQAGGVTIHSLFLLPFGSFVPSQEPEGNFSAEGSFFTQHTLLKRHPLNRNRIKVLRSIELLVIDEVSMLRADILDAIDFRLKVARKNSREPFGGVQILFIGDLFQLPPIVKKNEEDVLHKFYSSLHFFEATSLRQSEMIYMELDKIFRQSDPKFIDLLNHLRMNEIYPEEIKFLNSFYKKEDELKTLDEVITITTHNAKAEAQNRRTLEALKKDSYFFHAEITGDFPESLYPVPKLLELKEGAQIMFIKNDSSGYGSYFNGKLAVIKEITKDSIIVGTKEKDWNFQLRKERWENKKYRVNEETKEIEEEVIGTFDHYPIKLAWAVTVHKSQGLTFDSAIIDVGSAFSPGQVYVALSRLRGLEGLYLKSRLSYDAFRSDAKAVAFSISAANQPPLLNLLEEKRKQYLLRLFQKTFDFGDIMETIRQFMEDGNHVIETSITDIHKSLSEIMVSLLKENEYSIKYQKQLSHLLVEKETKILHERIEKGCSYYGDLIRELLKIFFAHLAAVEAEEDTQTYLEGLSEVELVLFNKLTALEKVKLILNEADQNLIKAELDDLVKTHAFLRINYLQEARNLVKKQNLERDLQKEKAVQHQYPRHPKKVFVLELANSGRSIQEISTLTGFTEKAVQKQIINGIALGWIDLSKLYDQESINKVKLKVESDPRSIKKISRDFQSEAEKIALKYIGAHLGKI